VSTPLGNPTIAGFAALVVALLTSLTTFVVLFSSFSQSTAIAMKGFGWSGPLADTD
jgi:ABC-type uncharacterized transport system permease subunit